MRRPHALARQTLEAVKIFGLDVARVRRERRWTSAELAERVGISRTTLSRLEAGDPTVALGIAFEVATVVGIPLFGVGSKELPGLLAHSRDMLALLPAKVRPSAEIENAF
jgi:DNA-binding XRE family transcriptional regulator